MKNKKSEQKMDHKLSILQILRKLRETRRNAPCYSWVFRAPGLPAPRRRFLFRSYQEFQTCTLREINARRHAEWVWLYFGLPSIFFFFLLNNPRDWSSIRNRHHITCDATTLRKYSDEEKYECNSYQTLSEAKRKAGKQNAFPTFVFRKWKKVSVCFYLILLVGGGGAWFLHLSAHVCVTIVLVNGTERVQVVWTSTGNHYGYRSWKCCVVWMFFSYCFFLFGSFIWVFFAKFSAAVVFCLTDAVCRRTSFLFVLVAMGSKLRKMTFTR